MDIVGRIHQAKPSLILNIDNEYMTFKLMEEVKDYYESRGLQVPKRHYFNRFVKDFRICETFLLSLLSAAIYNSIDLLFMKSAMSTARASSVSMAASSTHS